MTDAAREAEKAIVGDLLENPGLWWEYADTGLKAEDFAQTGPRDVFIAIREIVAASGDVTEIAVSEALRARGVTMSVEAVEAFAEHSHLGYGVREHAHAVREAARARRAEAAARALIRDLERGEQSVEALVGATAEALLASTAEDAAKAIVSGEEWATRVGEAVEAASRSDGMLGIPTGLRELDLRTSGICRGQFWLLGARPSIGKSAMAGGIAADAAERGYRGLFVPLEDAADALGMRIAARRARVNLGDLRRGRTDFTKFASALGYLEGLGIDVLDSPSVTAADIARRVSMARMQGKPYDFVIVDYIQRMKDPPGRKDQNKNLAVGENAKALKTMAREENVGVLCLAQLGREVERRTDKRPMMSDLRDSGELEQEADVILFLHRDEYYMKDKTPADRIGVAEVMIAKQRHGATGHFDVRFCALWAGFEDMEDDNG